MSSGHSSAERAFRERDRLRVLRRAISAAGIDAPVHYDEITESTNATVLREAEQGAPEFIVAVAGHQTAGRGRLGRTWMSEPGASLLFSFLLRPKLPPEAAVVLSLGAGAAMARACHDVARADVRCKWPNDLVFGDGKVGGILTEANVQGGPLRHVVVGIGMNLSAVPPGVEGTALGAVDRDDLLTAFFRRFRDLYSPEPSGFADRVITAYHPYCSTLRRRVRASTVDGRLIEGVAIDLDRGGNLVVQASGGREVVAFGEVEHLR